MTSWGGMVRRSGGEEVRKENIEADFKNAIEKAARKYVDDIFNTMLQSGCSLDVIKHCYPVVVLYYDNSIMIYDLLDKDEYSDFSYDDVEEWDLKYYPKVAIRQYAKEAILALENDGKEVEVKKTSRPIDYPALKDILRYLFEKNSRVADNPLLKDLCGRALNIFKFVYDEICSDADLKQLENENNIDTIVDRVVELLSKYDGIDIPAPYEDIDDWWGDFNSTINYLVWSYKEEM